jgi:hypothetical protein
MLLKEQRHKEFHLEQLLSLIFKINRKSLELVFNYQEAWSPRRYCKYAVTNKPAIVTGTNPKTIPDNKGSTIK